MRPVKQNKHQNIIFYTEANMKKKKMEVLFKTIYKKMSQNIQYSQYIQRTNQKKQK